VEEVRTGLGHYLATPYQHIDAGKRSDIDIKRLASIEAPL